MEVGKYTTFLGEAFDQDSLKASAEKWLKAKFGDKYEFIYKPNLTDAQKTYSASIDGHQFDIAGKKFDTDGDGTPDTVCYKIIASEEEEQEEEQEEEF